MLSFINRLEGFWKRLKTVLFFLRDGRWLLLSGLLWLSGVLALAQGSSKTQSVMEIVLVRHARPDITKMGLKSYKEAVAFAENYRLAGVEDFDPVPIRKSIGQMPEGSLLLTSGLFRAQNTARILFDTLPVPQAYPAFNEFEIEVVHLPLVVLPIDVWMLISRLAWFFDVRGEQVESRPEALQRMKTAADILEAAAQKGGKVVLVAHGLMNRSLSKELKRRGWKQAGHSGFGHLGLQKFCKSQKEAP